MVHVELWRPGDDAGRSRCVAMLTQRGHERPNVEGPEPQVVDLERVVLSLSTGEAIRFEDDPEEWARSLPGSYRSPYLLAEVVHDEHPVAEQGDEHLVVGSGAVRADGEPPFMGRCGRAGR